ncbi:FAGL151Wp [Eremothecium gossypii FDAG1]|nr:FAGL151Wp [Eremothecium gossypii FDAG1]
MSNPFDLLGNDVEDATVVVSPPKELVKKTTSSKKADVPPPSADPSRAKNNRPKPTGNEAAFRDKQAGRSQNKSKDAPAPGKPAKDSRKTFDRHSRTGKTDSAKKIKQAWGDNEKEQADEEAGAAVAEAELAADAAEEEQATAAAVTLEAYLEQQNSDLNKAPVARKVEKFDDAELFVKKQEVFMEATKVKNVKTKHLKAKQFLEFDGTESFAPKSRDQRDNKRGGKGGNRGGKGGNREPAQAKPVNANFPALI